MKIVVLESSPNRNGASNTLAGYFIKGAEEAEHIVRVLDVAHMGIRPCTGCYRGKRMGHCVLPDDMRTVEKEIYDANMVVYVTPIYFYDMSAQLKIVMDRMHCCLQRHIGVMMKSCIIWIPFIVDWRGSCTTKTLERLWQRDVETLNSCMTAVMQSRLMNWENHYKTGGNDSDSTYFYWDL